MRRSNPSDSDPDNAGVSRRTFLVAGTAAAAGAAFAAAGPADAAVRGSGAPASPAFRPAAPAGGRLLQPIDRQVEYAADRLGTDVRRPRFGWSFEPGSTGAQTAYQLQVATSVEALRGGEPDVWDSGRVPSSDLVGVAYDGPDLAPRTRYHWRVRTWDERGAGFWSRGDWFETALLDDGWAGAQWIGTAPPPAEIERTLDGAQWIWSPGSTAQGGPVGTRRLRGHLDLPEDLEVAAAYLVMTADDYYTGYLDGTQVLESAPVTDGWRTAETVDITAEASAAVGGRLVVAAQVTNAGSVAINPGGLLARLRVIGPGGDILDLVTDSDWRITEAEPDGWQDPDFDDSGWSPAAELAGYGEGPWGSGVTIPKPAAIDLRDARWIWAQGSTPQDGVAGTRYLRGGLDLPAGTAVRSATLLMTADDDFTAWLSGGQVLHAPQQADGWKLGQLADVTDAARASVGGRLVIATRSTNRPGAAVNPGGLICKLIVRTDGDDLVLVTNGSWVITENEQNGWQETDFDDSSWTAATEVAEYGAAPWGTGVTIAEPVTPAPLVRREFTVDRDVTAARLYVSAGGYAAVEVNGRPVSEAVLEPGFTDYDDTVLYVVHDVTGLIAKGRNAIGAELGRGFYGMTTPNAWNWNRTPWTGDPRLLARLVMTHPDGSTTEVISDQNWRIADGPTVLDNLYAGESYDARLAPTGWTEPGFDDTEWGAASMVPGPSGRLTAQENEPIKIVDTVAPTAISSPSDGVWVVDFGRTVAGWTRLRATLPAGTEVLMKHGEVLDADGFVVAANGNAPGRCQLDSYTAVGTGDAEQWEPRFTYHGFRYVQVDGLPATPDQDTLTMRVVYSDIADAGEFTCSDELYSRFEKMMRRTVHNNLHGLPTDTPMYEKNGWTGDAQVAATTMAQLLSMQRLFTKWLGDLRDSQTAAGQPAVIVPSGGWGYTQLAPAPEWTTVYPYLLREMHRWYGDERLLADHYPSVVRYLDWEIDRLVDGLALTALGDYLSPGTGGNPPEDRRLTATAYLHRALLATAEVGELLGDEAVPARYRSQADALRDRLNIEFLDTAAGHYRTALDPEYRQTSNVIPLAFGLVPEQYIESVFASLVDDITARDNHLNTGCLGTSELLPLLTRFGRTDLAAAIARQRTYPSWGFWVENGAETMWEFWQVPGRSRNHYFQGTVVQWLLQNVAGLRPVADGWSRMLVRPDARDGVTSASHALHTVRGRAASSWESVDGRFSLRVTVPVGATAEVHVPAVAAGDTGCSPRADAPEFVDGYAVYTVGAGAWHFISTSAS